MRTIIRDEYVAFDFEKSTSTDHKASKKNLGIYSCSLWNTFKLPMRKHICVVSACHVSVDATFMSMLHLTFSKGNPTTGPSPKNEIRSSSIRKIQR